MSFVKLILFFLKENYKDDNINRLISLCWLNEIVYIKYLVYFRELVNIFIIIVIVVIEYLKDYSDL